MDTLARDGFRAWRRTFFPFRPPQRESGRPAFGDASR